MAGIVFFFLKKCWQIGVPPTSGLLKINVDGAFVQANSMGGVLCLVITEETVCWRRGGQVGGHT